MRTPMHRREIMQPVQPSTPPTVAGAVVTPQTLAGTFVTPQTLARAFVTPQPRPPAGSSPSQIPAHAVPRSQTAHPARPNPGFTGSGSFVTDTDRYEAVINRDGRAEGQFFYSVATTGVYCRPTCGARAPRRENVGFHATADLAEAAGFRACKRCRPRGPSQVDRDGVIAEAARRRIRASEGPLSLAELAAEAGLSTFHFHRLFKRQVGMTPRQFAAADRLQRFEHAVRDGASVTAAVHDAGYSSSSRFYEGASSALGMTPSQLKRGGDGLVVSVAIRACCLGRVLVATTARGVCAVAFGDDDQALWTELRNRFPRAQLRSADALDDGLVAGAPPVIDALDDGLVDAPPPVIDAFPDGPVRAGPAVIDQLPAGSVGAAPRVVDALPDGSVDAAPPVVAALPDGSVRAPRPVADALLDGAVGAAPPVADAPTSLVDQVVRWVDAAGVPPATIPLDLIGTAFQQRVWRALRDIPPGETATYTQIAERIGAPAAVRAVGSACAANPVALAVPCHRVLRTDGALGGYRWGLDRKKALLDRERGR